LRGVIVVLEAEDGCGEEGQAAVAAAFAPEECSPDEYASEGWRVLARLKVRVLARRHT
jgi:hypothetical protein